MALRLILLDLKVVECRACTGKAQRARKKSENEPYEYWAMSSSLPTGDGGCSKVVVVVKVSFEKAVRRRKLTEQDIKDLGGEQVYNWILAQPGYEWVSLWKIHDTFKVPLCISHLQDTEGCLDDDEVHEERGGLGEAADEEER